MAPEKYVDLVADHRCPDGDFRNLYPQHPVNLVCPGRHFGHGHGPDPWNRPGIQLIVFALGSLAGLVMLRPYILAKRDMGRKQRGQ